MHVLIVDDSDAKVRAVAAVLEDATPSPIVDRARSFRSAVRCLEAASYDLLILDLLLPIRDGEEPEARGGKRVLTEIMEGSECRNPSHIICLTAFDDMAESFKTEAARKLVHVVTYKETSNEWRLALMEKARSIQSRLRLSDTIPSDYMTDLAIVTSSPHMELHEVLKLPGFAGEFNQIDCLHYYSGTWKTTASRTLDVVACASPTMGMTAASVTACKVIQRWRPRFLAMTGIAAGTKSDQAFGDILIAEAAFDYGSGKIVETENGERLFMPSPNQLRIDPELHAILQDWERNQTRVLDIQRAWDIHGRVNPKLIIGLLATGAAVVQDRNLVDEILKNSRKVVGLEMEAYAIFHACHLASLPRPRVLVAKSVSDFADKQKDDSAQRYAAFTSARFVYEFFTNTPEFKLGRRDEDDAQ